MHILKIVPVPTNSLGTHTQASVSIYDESQQIKWHNSLQEILDTHLIYTENKGKTN